MESEDRKDTTVETEEGGQRWQSSLLSFLDKVKGRRKADREAIENARITIEKELSSTRRKPGDQNDNMNSEVTLEGCNIFGKPLVREEKMTGRIGKTRVFLTQSSVLW